ncbi:MAG: type II secretion system protein GspE, partial [Deltaproteobacteria bacterium]
MSNPQNTVPLKERLSEILLNSKLVTPEQLNEALNVQKEKGGRLSDILLDLKFIKEIDMISTLSQRLGLPLIDLKRCKVDYDVAKLIPMDIARHYQIIPISKMNDVITLAMADPLNIF